MANENVGPNVCDPRPRLGYPRQVACRRRISGASFAEGSCIGRAQKALPCFAVFLFLVFGATSCRTERITDEAQFDREISIRGVDRGTGLPNFIEVRPNMKIPIGDFWTRYETFFRIPPSALVQGRTRPSRLGSGYLTSFQQFHLGYPVAGGGFLVETERGMVQGANGHFILGLPPDLPRPIPRGAALHVAIGSLKLVGPPPWTTSNSYHYHPPVAELSLSREGVDGGFKLVWYVSFESTGISDRDVGGIVVDASNGAILGTLAGAIR